MIQGGFLAAHVVPATLRDRDLLRIAKGPPPFKRSAFLSALRVEPMPASRAPKRPLPTVYSGDPVPAPLPFDAADGHIRKIARRLAYYCGSDFPGAGDDLDVMAHLRNVCRVHHVEPPEIDPCTEDMRPAFARLACPRWWRRRLRASNARRTEARRIAAGVVHRSAQCYASDSAVHRRRQSATRNRALLDMLTAVNEHGETFTLADLADRTASNPELRRHELMTRAAGLEALADERRDRALFVTWTLPSRFHAITADGHRNPKHDGSTPRDGSAWLSLQWGRVRAQLAKLKLRPYGLRVAEPHHDGTPHWHLLLFAPKRDHRMIAATMAEAAFAEGDEPGARKHRITFELVQKGTDPKTGKARSAVGYLSKYLAKNVDGHQVGMAMERGSDGELRFTGDAATACERIRAWASTWGVRQFQFFGVPPVTVWRELRRVREPVGDHLPATEAARAAADVHDYAGHVRAVGGLCKARRELDLTTHKEHRRDAAGAVVLNRYGEEPPPAVKGVAEVLARYLSKIPAALRRMGIRPRDPLIVAAPTVTRLHTWTLLEPREGGAVPPRTRVNNRNRGLNDDQETNPENGDLDRRRRPGAAWIRPEHAAGILAAAGWRRDLDPDDDGDDFGPAADGQDGPEGMDAGAGCWQ